MGDIIFINCDACGWSKSGFIGHRFNTLQDYEDIENDLPKRFKKKLEKEKFAGVVSSPRVITICSSCFQVDFRTHYEALGIEAEHWCGRCREKANIVKSPEILQHCPNCGRGPVDVEPAGIWD